MLYWLLNFYLGFPVQAMKKLIHGVHFEQYKKTGAPAHFYGANGFPTKGYHAFLALLKAEYSLSTLHNRATWPNATMPNRIRWQLYADDLIFHLEENVKEPVIGIGHSLGASATLLAAIKRPDLFSSLVLIEPAMTSPLISKLLPFVPFSISKKVQPIKHTVQKPQFWQSEKHFYDDCRQRNVFKRISDENLSLLATHSLVSDEQQGKRLKFPKLWEARNYAAAPNLYKAFAQLTVPFVAIRGKPSAYFSQQSWDKMQQLGSNGAVFKENPNYGHLFPLEAPQACFDLIYSGLTESATGMR